MGENPSISFVCPLVCLCAAVLVEHVLLKTTPQQLLKDSTPCKRATAVRHLGLKCLSCKQEILFLKPCGVSLPVFALCRLVIGQETLTMLLLF